MFILPIQMNRQSSIGGCYFLYFLFLLHICTAFLTIINAFNHDKEEIIQLSMDSIHIVKSAESQMINIEENTNDVEEKDLLLALLTSYDDEIQINKSTNNEIPIRNSSSPIRFIPSSIHFEEQSIAIPKMQTVIIINEYFEPLELYSLSGTTNEFYSSIFKQNILLPNGGNTTINIYYLPRTIGHRETVFHLKTNLGNFSYEISGIGKANQFHLRPLINIEIPINSTFEYTIKFSNPYNYSLNINEIYTSDENLIIELLTNKKSKNRLTKLLPYHEQWYLKPYETKSIIKINYFAYKLNQLFAFICMKTNLNEKIILPIEINVLNRFGLYSNVDLLEFSNERFLCSIIKSVKVPVYVFNYGINPVMITDVRVTPEHRDYITIRYKNLQILPDIHRLNQIADITIHPNLIPDNINHINGYIEVYTTTNYEKPVLKIPFDERILHGLLDFKKEETYFYIPNDELYKSCQTIRVFNGYDTPISVYNITINKFDILSKYIQIKYPSSVFNLHSNQWNDLLCINFLKQSFSSFRNLQTVIDIHTNLSYFYFPIHLYNGFIDLNLLSDHTNGGIKQNELDPFELLTTSIPVNTIRIVTFVLTNSNPVDIEIEKFEFNLSNINIQLDYIESLNGNNTKIKYDDPDLSSKFIIPQQHQAIFLLKINAKDSPKLYSESITVKTQFQMLDFNLKYEIINGSIEFVNKTPIHIEVFPSRIGTNDIYLLNKFNEFVNITHIDFLAYGLCFSFTWTNTSIDRVILQPNQIQKIGKLNFDMIPLCKSIHIPSESTCYCGLNHHPEFKQQWNEYISLLNTYELDSILVKKFRNFWKEWVSLIRKHRIQTNIWLYTNRANISWPVTINFIWPSVLEQMSSSTSLSPTIIDFQVTSINITKIQNVIISNPSSDLVTYSVELLNDHSNKLQSFFNNEFFTISATSKQIEIINNIYHFNLLPNEQITFTISHRPTLSMKYEMYFVIRNNLTILESILLRGEGGLGSLQVGNRKIGSPITPILVEVNENQPNLCSNSGENLVLQKIITLQNTGNIKTIIHDIGFGSWKCHGQGFHAPVCSNIELEPNEKYDLKILFQPDYTSIETKAILTLNTNIGLMAFPIIARIPKNILTKCYKAIPRPNWEFRPYCFCLCSLIIVIIFILTFAVFDARRLFDNYVVRAEWRDRIQTTTNKIFNLTDLSSAIQDEQKSRMDLIESNQTTDVKKEKTIEIKPKRSTRTSDSSRPVIVIPKEVPQKTRRATTDNGQPKPLKPPHEVIRKPEPLRRLKSDQNPSYVVPKPVSSSTVSEEESEPFVIARSRRIINKRKGSISNTSSKSAADNTPPIIRKIYPHTNQQNSIDLDDSNNDQQWHTVTSNKGQRKGTTVNRPEASEESQPTNQTIKVPLNDSEKSMILTSSSPPPPAHSPVSRETKKSRRHRPTRKLSPTSVVPISIKRKSLQDNAPSALINRELAFRQLTEQLWAAGLPSSTTACSMSIRSRCSSAPPSERGGGGDEFKKPDWNNHDTNDEEEEEENIDWDEPNIPDEDFGRFTSQNENSMDETQQKSTINNIPPLMSLSITPPPGIMTNIQQKSVIKENIEPLPFPSHGPGPIQRPNKLSLSSYIQDSPQSPSTPDVLVQINHLVDQQNSAPTNINEVSTPNVSWTPFSPPEWSTKYDPAWSLTNIQSQNIQTQNPFAQRQISKDDSSLWSAGLPPTTPMNPTTWLKFSPVSETAPSDKQENNPFWNPINVPETQPTAPTSWWSKTPSDENNNDHSRWDFAR